MCSALSCQLTRTPPTVTPSKPPLHNANPIRNTVDYKTIWQRLWYDKTDILSLGIVWDWSIDCTSSIFMNPANHTLIASPTSVHSGMLALFSLLLCSSFQLTSSCLQVGQLSSNPSTVILSQLFSQNARRLPKSSVQPRCCIFPNPTSPTMRRQISRDCMPNTRS